MRIALVLLSLVIGTAAASNYRDVQRAVKDDQLLLMAGVSPEQARVRAQCQAAVLDSDDTPNFFDCVYVQTETGLNILSMEDGYVMSEVQLPLANIDGVALQRMGKYSQVQLFDGHRVAVFYIHGDSWIDPKKTESVYQWLVEQGVARRQPIRWVGP